MFLGIFLVMCENILICFYHLKVRTGHFVCYKLFSSVGKILFEENLTFDDVPEIVNPYIPLEIVDCLSPETFQKSRRLSFGFPVVVIDFDTFWEYVCVNFCELIFYFYK
jgi:hypothetical protein